jgi:hypothetical protein
MKSKGNDLKSVLALNEIFGHNLYLHIISSQHAEFFTISQNYDIRKGNDTKTRGSWLDLLKKLR